MDFKIGDKVRFVGKTKGESKEAISQGIGLNLLTECYGVIHSFEKGCRCCIRKISDGSIPISDVYRDILRFSVSDLIPFENINYDDLSEIEE